ncbi:MAG: thiamine phosphate synthase [Taibaiella sp.]
MKPQLKLPGIYAISPEQENTALLLEQIAAAINGGVRLIQYRDKSLNSSKRIEQAQSLRQLCNESGALLLINDDIELAKISEADGVHLGQSDTSITKAREYLGEDAIIGITCHDSLELAQKAKLEGADYLSFGCFFPSKTKPHAKPADLSILKKAKEQFELPIVAIGGIDKSNAYQLVASGADLLAICAGLFNDEDIFHSGCEIYSIMKS